MYKTRTNLEAIMSRVPSPEHLFEIFFPLSNLLITRNSRGWKKERHLRRISPYETNLSFSRTMKNLFNGESLRTRPLSSCCSGFVVKEELQNLSNAMGTF